MNYTLTQSCSLDGKQKLASKRMLNNFLKAKKYYKISNYQKHFPDVNWYSISKQYYKTKTNSAVVPFCKKDNVTTFKLIRNNGRVAYLHQIYNDALIKIKISTFRYAFTLCVKTDISGKELLSKAIQMYCTINSLSHEEMSKAQLINHRTIIRYDTEDQLFNVKGHISKMDRTFRIYIPGLDALSI